MLNLKGYGALLVWRKKSREQPIACQKDCQNMSQSVWAC